MNYWQLLDVSGTYARELPGVVTAVAFVVSFLLGSVGLLDLRFRGFRLLAVLLAMSVVAATPLPHLGFQRNADCLNAHVEAVLLATEAGDEELLDSISGRANCGPIEWARSNYEDDTQPIVILLGAGGVFQDAGSLVWSEQPIEDCRAVIDRCLTLDTIDDKRSSVGVRRTTPSG